MPTAAFFTRFGLFATPNFLDADLCKAVRAHACPSSWAPAKIYRDGGIVDENVRRTQTMPVPKPVRAALEERLRSLKPTLGRHFGFELSGFEVPTLLRYTEGSFFTPHRDNTSAPDGDECAQRRRISVSVFVNNQSEEPAAGSYCGGSLTFYELMDDPRAKEFGFPLVGEEGLLIAFRSEIAHEVKPITYGERYSIVTWFF